MGPADTPNLPATGTPVASVALLHRGARGDCRATYAGGDGPRRFDVRVGGIYSAGPSVEASEGPRELVAGACHDRRMPGPWSQEDAEAELERLEGELADAEEDHRIITARRQDAAICRATKSRTTAGGRSALRSPHRTPALRRVTWNWPHVRSVSRRYRALPIPGLPCLGQRQPGAMRPTSGSARCCRVRSSTPTPSGTCTAATSA